MPSGAPVFEHDAGYSNGLIKKQRKIKGKF